MGDYQAIEFGGIHYRESGKGLLCKQSQVIMMKIVVEILLNTQKNPLK